LIDTDSDEVIMQFDHSELGLMKSVYKKQNHPIGKKEKFYLSDKQYKALKNAGYEKTDKVDVKIDYNDTEAVLHNNVLRKIDQKYPIVLFDENVTGQKNNDAVITKVKERLTSKGYVVIQTRVLSATYEVGNATADMLLEFLTGHKIKGEKFTLSDTEQFNNVFYYDNNPDRIIFLKKINEILNHRLESSRKEIANNVSNFINEAEATLSLNGISNNEVNPISTYFIKIGAMMRHVKNFESWKGL